MDSVKKQRRTAMRAVPLTRRQASEFVVSLHRHHPPAHGDKYRVGCEVDGRLVGVVQVGRPVARGLDDGKTVEVTRLCTDGTPHVCSFLYGRAARIAREMGYSRIVTYILADESGISLRAAGWHKEADTRGHPWDHLSRPRRTQAPTCDKQRWARKLIPDPLHDAC